MSQIPVFWWLDHWQSYGWIPHFHIKSPNFHVTWLGHGSSTEWTMLNHVKPIWHGKSRRVNHFHNGYDLFKIYHFWISNMNFMGCYSYHYHSLKGYPPVINHGNGEFLMLDPHRVDISIDNQKREDKWCSLIFAWHWSIDNYYRYIIIQFSWDSIDNYYRYPMVSWGFYCSFGENPL